MATFIPRNTVEWKLEDLATFRRFTRSLVAMAVVTGLVMRVFRYVVLTLGTGQGIIYFGGLLAIALVFLFGMATLHLGNYPLRHWFVRAPLFALLEAATESVISLVLTALHAEPIGSGRATFRNAPGIVLDVFIWRVSSILLFALILATMTQLVRVWMVRRVNRVHTARAVHDEIERHTKEHPRTPLP